MKTSYSENLSVSARSLRVAVSTLVIVAAMNSIYVGTAVFALITVLAIGLTLSAVIGWDPLKALALNVKNLVSHHGAPHTSSHA